MVSGNGQHAGVILAPEHRVVVVSSEARDVRPRAQSHLPRQPALWREVPAHGVLGDSCARQNGESRFLDDQYAVCSARWDVVT